jgi:hypothetical protein
LYHVLPHCWYVMPFTTVLVQEVGGSSYTVLPIAFEAMVPAAKPAAAAPHPP